MRDGDQVETLIREILDWHAESAPYPTETETGDFGQVNIRGRRALAFAVDALGHGPEAARVADIAQRFLAQISFDDRLEHVFERCHEHFRGTRGLAMCLGMIDGERGDMHWLSVGNIQAVHIQLDANGIPRFESLIMRAGVVGDRLPELRVSRTPLKTGDMIVFATDGVDYGWYREYRHDISPRELTTALIRRHCHGKDDAMAMAMRYGGVDGDGTI